MILSSNWWEFWSMLAQPTLGIIIRMLSFLALQNIVIWKNKLYRFIEAKLG